MLLFSALVFATAPFLYLFVTKLWQLALVRFYHGLATAAFVPVAMALVADLFHEERGEKMGWFSTATLVGRFVAPTAGGALMSLLAASPGFRYKAVYLLCGAAGVLSLVLIVGVGEPEKSATRHQSWAETFSGLREILSCGAILATSATEAGILFAYGTFETFLPLYALRCGLRPYEIGVCLSAQVISLALTKPLLGKLSDRHGRPPQIFAGTLLGAASISCFAFFGSFAAFAVLSVFFGVAMSTLTSATSAYIADLSGKARGSAMGMLGSIMDTGHTSGPIVAGVVAGGLGYPFSFLCAAAVLAGFSAVFVATVFRKGP